MVDAELVTRGDALGNLFVAAHRCRARSGAHQAESGTKLRGDDADHISDVTGHDGGGTRDVGPADCPYRRCAQAR